MCLRMSTLYSPSLYTLVDWTTLSRVNQTELERSRTVPISNQTLRTDVRAGSWIISMVDID